jgi:hypothetical protein
VRRRLRRSARYCCCGGDSAAGPVPGGWRPDRGREGSGAAAVVGGAAAVPCVGCGLRTANAEGGGRAMRRRRTTVSAGTGWMVGGSCSQIVVERRVGQAVLAAARFVFDPCAGQSAAENAPSQPGCRFVVRRASQTGARVPTSGSASTLTVAIAISGAVVVPAPVLVLVPVPVPGPVLVLVPGPVHVLVAAAVAACMRGFLLQASLRAASAAGRTRTRGLSTCLPQTLLAGRADRRQTPAGRTGAAAVGWAASAAGQDPDSPGCRR